MPLSQRSKENLQTTVKATIAIVGLERCQRIGPRQFTEAIVNGKARNHPDTINVRENRDEAERYLAGLLGLF